MALGATDATRGRGTVVVGGALVTVCAAELAVLECFLLPLRIGAIPVPLSIVAAVFGNALLPGLAYRLTGSRVAALLPLLVWTVVVILAAVPRPEGDVIVTGTARGIGFLLLGAVAGAYAAGRLLTAPPRAAIGGDPGT